MIVSVRLLKSPSTILVGDCVVVGVLGYDSLRAWTSGERAGALRLSPKARDVRVRLRAQQLVRARYHNFEVSL